MDTYAADTHAGRATDEEARSPSGRRGAPREAPRFRGRLDERGALHVRFDDEELTLGAFLRRLRLVQDGLVQDGPVDGGRVRGAEGESR